MKQWLYLNLTAVVFAIGSIILAYHNVDGWGWLVLASLLALYPYRVKKDDN